MQKYFVVVVFLGLCYGYSLGFEEDILGLPVLDYDDSKNYDLFWNAQYNTLQQEKNQQRDLDQTIKQLCEDNDFTLEDILINCENIKIIPKVNKAVIKKRDVTEVLEEGSGDDAPEDLKFEENKETGSLAEQSVSVESAPVETAPVVAEPVEAVPVEAVPVEAAPVETAPVEAVPVETATIKAAVITEIATEKAAVITEIATEEAAPEEVEPVEAAAPAEVVPVEIAAEEAATAVAAPVEAVPVETASVEAAPVDTVPVEAAPVRLGAVPLGSAPAEPVPVETAGVGVESSAAPGESAPESSKTTASVSQVATVASKSGEESAKVENKEVNEKQEKGDKSSGSNLGETDEKSGGSEDRKERKFTQEELNDKQTGVAVVNVDAGMAETEAKLSKMDPNESIKTASIGGVGESTATTAGRSDNKVLITLFVGVVAVGLAAFSYNYIKKRKRNSASSRTKNGVVQSDPEEGSEMKPLVRENSPNVEYKNEKKENVST